ncbi:kynurenine formamidase [Promicromonospora sp. AC04]|uniref:cyclase family protein n=1 Tax=Promicromonospora sp. AC04 TaxID=2135723 RepID=UPI000D3A8784|nr:cyclase family protein [Promicromonospora sp. AC04]PUB24842.1 kynurenine formamidase [Promicromonospora sp. AC04]
MTGVIDINIPIHTEMLHWGRRPTFEMVERIADGSPSDVSRWLIGAHTGTHVDAPAHFVPGGATVEQIPLEHLVGPTRVLDLRGVAEEITAEDLEAAGAEGAARVLFKTRNSTEALTRNTRSETWVGLAPSGAQWLVDHDVVFAGLDYMTMEAPAHTEAWPTHVILCGAGVVILENADLAQVEPGDYLMVCQPVPFEGREAAPAPTVLLPLPGSTSGKGPETIVLDGGGADA